MIEQKPVQIGDQTAPATIHDIRERITQAVDTTEGTAFERLRFWLQMPTDSRFVKMLDVKCLIRAGLVGTRLSTGGQEPYTPASLTVAIGLKARWEAIDKKLAAGQTVVINGASGHVCGDRSRFVTEQDVGFHVILFLATGTDVDGRRFYLGLDPDVSATEQSRATWQESVPEGTEVEKLEEAAAGTRIIKALLLGDSVDGFGPLVRKYYVETDKPFPKITRG